MAQNREDAQDDSEKTEAEEAAEQRAWEMEEKVESLQFWYKIHKLRVIQTQ
jgi:hypothetical protein